MRLDLLEVLMRSSPGDLESETLTEMLARPAWHDGASCRGRRTGSWFPPRGHRPDEARIVCAGCPVVVACRVWALDQGPELAGVWAGLSEKDRNRIRRRAAQRRLMGLTWRGSPTGLC